MARQAITETTIWRSSITMGKRSQKAETEEGDLTVDERMLEEEAAYWDRHMDDDPGPEVKFRVVKDIKHVYSFRVGAEELDEIADAAEAAGQDVSAFIREAALKEARRRKSSSPAVDDVRKKAKELAEAVERL
jgi:uncharacterized protein (DUF1778 family)